MTNKIWDWTQWLVQDWNKPNPTSDSPGWIDEKPTSADIAELEKQHKQAQEKDNLVATDLSEQIKNWEQTKPTNIKELSAWWQEEDILWMWIVKVSPERDIFIKSDWNVLTTLQGVERLKAMGLASLPTREDIDKLGKILSEKGYNSLYWDFYSKENAKIFNNQVAPIIIKEDL